MDKKAGVIKRYFKYALIGLVTGTANGLFGSGGGTIAVPAMVLLLGVEDHKAHATAISIILPLTLISAFFYVKNNFVDWALTIKVTLGGIAGGYIGAKLLNICPARVLRRIFAAFMIAAALRMIL
ncbi:permease [Clostridium thermosuccinogenes]|uniref:Probable membrane transporter protein n=1 Tax=Clostridium thermosuccinogenes TaxID=84032 RepID=A0A2K2FL92_9CLOT|nr:sulfite exporter TauE/SafE family protein [Pseudoclostridium thermosuccinogenes]AUS96645.1 permease [Pseudoclostridium thermosuccinogenes]PNT97561.1 permease [Pseudoclostridium thermosuccinogenes]PNT99557.1 permease [Pseudoclostridium thermosuccinogenes]